MTDRRDTGQQPPTYVYEAYDAEGTLLYVGITDNVTARLKAHSHGKEWWSQVDQITTESFSSRTLALAAEAERIRTRRPRYNITHSLVNAKAAPADRQPLGTPIATGMRKLSVSVVREHPWWVFEIPN